MSKQFKPKYVKKILITSTQVDKSIADAAKWLNKKFEHKNETPLFVGVLRGSAPFFGNLIMKLNFDMTTDFLRISSFRGMKRVQDPKICDALDTPVKGKHVVIVEDIVDSAKTMSLLVKTLKRCKAKSITTVCLVDKPQARQVKFKVSYACNTLLGNPFLVGWGLDVHEKARNLPYIAEFDKRYINKV